MCECHICAIGLQDTDNLWWDSFSTDFFEDDATLTLTFGLEDGVKRYSVYTKNNINIVYNIYWTTSLLTLVYIDLTSAGCGFNSKYSTVF